jgi:hypothetical protein
MPTVLLCSLASFLASVGIGLLGFSESNRRRLILAFAACDLVATFTGASWHTGLLQMYSGGLKDPHGSPPPRKRNGLAFGFAA